MTCHEEIRLVEVAHDGHTLSQASANLGSGPLMRRGHQAHARWEVSLAMCLTGRGRRPHAGRCRHRTWGGVTGCAPHREDGSGGIRGWLWVVVELTEGWE
jgi:hypothetical protein